MRSFVLHTPLLCSHTTLSDDGQQHLYSSASSHSLHATNVTLLLAAVPLWHCLYILRRLWCAYY